MQITVFGATGPTGMEVVNDALGKGWDVVAAVRSPGALVSSDVLTVVEGDVLDPATARTAISGSHAVLSLLGFHRHLRGPSTTDLYSRSATTFVDVMSESPTTRLIYTTSAGVELDDPSELWPYRHIVKPLWLDGTYEDMRRAEEIIRSSSLAWTLVRPGRLVDGPATGRYEVSPRFRPEHANAISRADLASFLLDQVEGTQWLKATPTLGTPRA